MFRRLRRLLVSETISGYENPELVEVVFQKTFAYSPTKDWPEIANVRTVLDFGGGCGIHYKEATRVAPSILWAVVETPAMALRAKELETDRLRFFDSIDSAVSWLGPPDTVHSNGALQYTPNPIEVLRNLCALQAKTMLWYRVLLGQPVKELQSSFLGDNGPGSISLKEKKVDYQRERISEQAFLAAHSGYRLAERGTDWFRFQSLM